jgi:hypothetical protein
VVNFERGGNRELFFNGNGVSNEESDHNNMRVTPLDCTLKMLK